MAASRKSGGSMVSIASFKRRSGGAWVAASSVKRRSGGAWITVWPVGITAVALPSSCSGSLVGAGSTGTVDSDYTTVTPSGGSGYTYAWAYVSGSTMTVSNPTAATTRFTAAVTAAVGTKTAVYRCTVTATGGFTTTVDVSITLTYEQSGV